MWFLSHVVAASSSVTLERLCWCMQTENLSYNEKHSSPEEDTNYTPLGFWSWKILLFFYNLSVLTITIMSLLVCLGGQNVILVGHQVWLWSYCINFLPSGPGGDWMYVQSQFSLLCEFSVWRKAPQCLLQCECTTCSFHPNDTARTARWRLKGAIWWQQSITAHFEHIDSTRKQIYFRQLWTKLMHI